jgi:hypothetical protein
MNCRQLIQQRLSELMVRWNFNAQNRAIHRRRLRQSPSGVSQDIVLVAESDLRDLAPKILRCRMALGQDAAHER